MRVLHLVNEPTLGYQIGPRSAFSSMVSDGYIEDYSAVSFLLTAAEAATDEGAQKAIALQVEQFAPDVIFWQHPKDFPADRDYVRSLRDRVPGVTIAYHEGDIYGTRAKPPTPAARALAAEADIVFLVGLGEYEDLFRRMGAARIHYSPHCVDHRFFHETAPSEPPEFDVVMIGNSVRSGLLKPAFPGGQNRRALAKALYREFGDRFAVFGSGWKGAPYDRGPIPFHAQSEVLRKSCLSCAWEHYDGTRYYFSDRLPIAMASGVVHATNQMPGYEELFSPGENLITFTSPDEAVERCRWFLSLPMRKRRDMAAVASDHARRNLTYDVVFRRMIDQIREYRDRDRDRG